MRVNLLRSRKDRKEMTPEQLAGEMGISNNSLSSRMSGRSSITLKQVKRICDILDIHDPKETELIFFT